MCGLIRKIINVGPYKLNMPECHLDEKSLKSLYEGFRNEDDKLNAIRKNPRYIAVLRISTGMGQTNFENFIGMSKNLYKYESGKIMPTEKTAKKFLSKFGVLAPWESVLQNFQKLSSESKGWFAANSASTKAMRARKKGAQSHMKKRALTSQEGEVARFLSERGVKYNANFKVGRVFVDFYIPKLKMAIECKKLLTKNRRGHMKKVREAAYQGYKAKFYGRNVRLVVVFESPLGLNATERHELVGPYNFVFEKVEGLKRIL